MATRDSQGAIEKARAALATQGQNWKTLQEVTAFQRPRGLFDVPREITIAQLRGMRMVDETLIVYGDMPETKE